MNETRQQLGRYEILRELGRGAMGVVYVAHDPHLQRTVAIKTIRIGGLSTQVSAEYERRFLTEARSAARLSHPAIVSVYDTGRDDEVTYLVMEYVNGINLKYCLRQGIKFSVLGAIRITLDVLSALEHAHAQKVVHRDIKPENLLLDVVGNVKLTDFGIARMQDGPDNGTMVSGLSIGTPRYMSPEQVQGLEVDARSDLFSAGVMLYELLTSTLPFEGVHPMAVVAKILHVAHAPVQGLRPEVPPTLAVVVDKALAKNPDLRYQTAQAFSAALVQACEGVLPLERLTQVTGGNGALALVEPESAPKLLWLLQGEPDPEPAQDPPGATTGASLAAAAASYAATTRTSTQGPTEQTVASAPTLSSAYQATSTTPTPAPVVATPVPPPPPVQRPPDDTTSSMGWDATSVEASSDFQPTVLDVAPSAFFPTPTPPRRRRLPPWWPALLAVPALGLAAWLMWGRSSVPAVPPAPLPTEAATPTPTTGPKEEVISTTSSAPLTPGAITPPPLTPPAPPTSPTAGTPAPATTKPTTKPKTDPTPAAPTPEPTPTPPPPPPPPPPPEPKPEPVKPPPPPKEPCQDKEGFFAREGCLWDACKLPAYRQMQVCVRFNHPKTNPN